jgi:hypothetical protein
MLHPVVPPDSPPVQEYIQPAYLLSSHSEVEELTGAEQEVILGKTDIRRGLVTQSLSSSPVPETFSPEFSPLNASQNAAVLGNSLSVGDGGKENINVDHTPMGKFPSYGAVLEKRTILTELFDFHSSQSAVVIPTPTPKNNIKNNIKNNESPVVVEQDGDQVNLRGTIETSKNQSSSVLVQNIVELKTRSEQESTQPMTLELSVAQQPVDNNSEVRKRVVEVVADRQEYDQQRRIVTAEGNVVVRFDDAVIDADRLQVNLNDLIAVGEGNIALTRGNQVFRGQRFIYNFVQDTGNLQSGSGEIYIPTTDTDFSLSPAQSTNLTPGGVPRRPVSDRIRANQPTSGVSSPGGINIDLVGQGDTRNLPPSQTGGTIKRMRFEAQRIDFYPDGWQAEDVRITNDPFSPPELELRASQVTLTKESPLVDRITTKKQRLVFDQNFALPIPINNQTIDRRERDIYPFIVSPGFDNGELGGLYLERGFPIVNTERTFWNVTPQFLIQKAFENNENNDFADLLAVETRLRTTLSPKTRVDGKAELNSLNLNQVENNLRGNISLRQDLGDVNPHVLNVEYSYRDRLYNGTLGFQTVQSSFGGIITSPIIPLGKGVNLSYQGGAQYINANTDRPDLLERGRKNDRVSLGRLQGSVALGTGFLLWQGEPLPPTATEGLKYSPNPVVPYLQAIAGVTGTTSYYTSGDNQSTLIGTVGLVGQVGNFSRTYLDYTGFNISYSQGFNSGLSPFLFDRSVDNRVLSAGISQQVYGPFRLGFQTSVNLDTGQESSTDYTLEYNRRTYGITLRYNPVLELGGFSIRISDFNWTGGTDPFADGDVKSVVDGVRQ